MIHFIADTHFNHKQAIKYFKRPFSTVEEMNEKLIENWNGCVNPEDDVYFLGDFSVGEYSDARKIFLRLNGFKRLIVGNHDSNVLALPWAATYTIHEMSVFGKQVVLCHYPLESWNQSHSGSIHLHGHVHNREKLMDIRPKQRFCVSVECVDYKPVLADEVLL